MSRLSELTESTTEYHQRVEGYAGRLEGADDIQALKTIVDELMTDTRSMQVDMTRYRDEMVLARRSAEQAEGKVRQLEAELEHVSEQVSQDQLTGVLNRRGLDEAMQREMARAERRKTGLCVAVIDLDNFKKLNDTYGHQAGDDALIHLTKVVRKTLRPTDTVARYGGEEFVIVFSETEPDAGGDGDAAAAARADQALLPAQQRAAAHHLQRRRRHARAGRDAGGRVRARRQGDVPGQSARQEPGGGSGVAAGNSCRPASCACGQAAGRFSAQDSNPLTP